MTQNNLQVSSASVSDKGLSDKRPQNEDSYLELRDSGLYAVADGVGGAQAGDVASQMAMEILGEAFINLQEDGDAEERMQLAIEQANGAIFQMSNDLPQLSTMATTVVALHINGNIATIGHVGDSRLYRLDSQGVLLQETQDHSVVEEEVRAGRMTPEQAAVHPSRNVISRALGADSEVEIDMKTIMFEPNTKFLVCTDGVTRHIPDEELKQILESEEDSFLVCQQIKTLCFERGAEDNLTAVVVSVTDESVENFDSTLPIEADIEQETVATARPPLVNSSLLSKHSEKAEQAVESESSFQDLNNESQQTKTLSNDDEDIKFPMKEEALNKADSEATANTKTSSLTETKNAVTSNDIKSYRVDEESGDGLAGKIISGILWLLIGGLIGAGITYYWLANQPNPDSRDFLKPRSTNVSMTSFEENRRNVDKDPAQFIATNVKPEDAIDYYLIGRAYLIQGNFASAKTNFLNAKEKLSETDAVNSKVLATEIALGLATVDNPFARKTFVDQLGIKVSDKTDEPKPDESKADN